MGNLGVVTVGHVDSVVLARSHVGGERLAVVRLVQVVFASFGFDGLLEERVGTGCEIGWVREGQDVLVTAQRETFRPAERRVDQLFPESLRKYRLRASSSGNERPRHMTGSCGRGCVVRSSSEGCSRCHFVLVA